MAKQVKLGRQLLTTLDDITDLIDVTHDEDRLKDLEEQRSKVLKQLGDLVEAHLDSSGKKYRDATSGLQAASATIRDAIKGMESVASAIKQIAKAIDLITELVPK